MTKNLKISVRLTPWQEQVLNELSQALDVSYSLLVRTIVGSWLTENEEFLYNIIDKKNIKNADNQQVRKEKDIFGPEGD
jgi:predicted DNA-binding protein